MSLRVYARRSPLLAAINARVKSIQLKRGLTNLSVRYEAQARRMGYHYSPDDAVDAFRQRLSQIAPGFNRRSYGTLRTFWVGANQSQDESGFLQALRRCGPVTEFKNIDGGYGIWYGGTDERAVDMSVVRRVNDSSLVDQVARAHAAGGIDVMLGQMWAHLQSHEGLAQVRAMGIPVVNISMDDRLPVHWSSVGGILLGSVGLGPGLDLVLTTSSETCLYYGVEGIPALFWPLASDPGVFTPPPDAPRDIEVLFIGNRYGIRGDIIDELARHGVQVDCYGSGWLNGSVDARQMADLSRRAKIILGIGTVGHCRDVYTMKLRDFDAVMTGALYITHRNPDLLRLYLEGHEIQCYDTVRELVIKLRWFLSHPEERIRIGMNGQRKALARDTWDQRLRSTFRALGLTTE